MLRYRKLGYVELNVSDLAASRAFYRDIVGLQPVEDGPASATFACGSDPCTVTLHQAAHPGFSCAGLMLEDDGQFQQLHRSLEQAGVAFEELDTAQCRRKRASRVTRIVEPHTTALLEFYTPASAGNASFTPSHTKIQRIGHVVFTSTERENAVRFFCDVLNFRVSDHIGENISFMRPFPSPYHHGLGVAQGPRHLFHHINFMVSEFDDIGKALNRCNRHGVPIVFGPGRHPASGSAFLYFLDPDGMTLEYSFGMEEFAEVDPRQPQVLPLKPASLDAWESPRDPRFASTGEIERLPNAGRQT